MLSCSRQIKLTCAAVLTVLCCGEPTTILAQQATSRMPTSNDATGRLFASPDFGQGNPYLISKQNNVDLPVSMAGFSAVALRDHQNWVPGSQRDPLVFDGQIYWFAGQRDRDIFAAAPQQYAPVLGGDCVVSYVSSGKLIMGKIEYGLIHARRIYFFAGASEREQFRNDPSRYANGDLAHDGKCLVSQVDHRQDVAGMPETVAVVNGLRYHFAGAHQRELFAGNMDRYGVKRKLLRAKGSRPVHSLNRVAADAEPEDPPLNSPEQPLAKKLAEQTEDHHYVMEGYCPVTLQDQNVWVRGSFRYLVKHDERKYLLAGEKEKLLFQENPGRYVPALGGDCVVTLKEENKLVAGDVKNTVFFQEEEKLYLFAGPDQKKAFLANRSRYLDSTQTLKEPVVGNETPNEPKASEQQPSS
jgi:YHS domain-containing protein